MPNYNYRNADYMRRGQCSRPVPPPPPPPDISCPPPSSMRSSECCTDEFPIAMAYVPWQKWENIYPAEKGFCRGTIFESLDKPFLGTGGCSK